MCFLTHCVFLCRAHGPHPASPAFTGDCAAFVTAACSRSPPAPDAAPASTSAGKRLYFQGLAPFPHFPQAATTRSGAIQQDSHQALDGIGRFKVNESYVAAATGPDMNEAGPHSPMSRFCGGTALRRKGLPGSFCAFFPLRNIVQTGVRKLLILYIVCLQPYAPLDTRFF